MINNLVWRWQADNTTCHHNTSLDRYQIHEDSRSVKAHIEHKYRRRKTCNLAFTTQLFVYAKSKSNKDTCGIRAFPQMT